MQLFDTHNDLLIQPYYNGVKLIKPNDVPTTLPTIGSLFAMPLIVYFVRPDATFVDANHLTRVTNIPGNKGYYSNTDLKGAPYSNLFCKETAQLLDHNNKKILHDTKRMMILDEECMRIDEMRFSAVSFKFPVYDIADQMVGIFGISALTDNIIFTEADRFSMALERIINTGLIPQIQAPNKSLLPGFEIDNIYLTKQEIRCIRHLISGKTIKHIGSELRLSPRTVEHYLENIKRKLNVKTKSDLIDKVVKHIWPEMFF